MRTFDENIIGKIFRDKYRLYIVSGYDYIFKDYVLVLCHNIFRINAEKSMYCLRMTDAIFEKLEDFNEVLEFHKNNKCDEQVIYDIYNSVVNKYTEDMLGNHEKQKIAKREISDFKKSFTRIRECHKNITSCEYYKNAFYRNEVNKHKKGLYRAEKRLFRHLEKEQFDIILKYLEENNYPHIETILTKAREYSDLINTLESIKKMM